MRDEKSAHDIERGKYDGEKAKQAAPKPATCQQCAHERNAANGVRTTHQGRMERGRNFGDDFEANKNGEHEDGGGSDEVHGETLG